MYPEHTIGEVSVLVHVVDVVPDRLELDSGVFIIINYFLQHGPIFIAPFALVKTKSPILHLLV